MDHVRDGRVGEPAELGVGRLASGVGREWYYAALFIPFTVTLTGIIASVPTAEANTDKWNAAIWPAAGGAALANSFLSGTACPNNVAEDFALPFTGTVMIPGPAVYFAGIQSNGDTCRLEVFNNNVEGFATGDTAGTFGTVISLTPPSTYTASVGPMLKTY